MLFKSSAMNKSASHFALRALVAAGTLTLLLVSGCQNQNSGQVEPSPTAGGTFTGQALPDKVEDLMGTPFYSSSKDLATQVKVEGACYLVIAPQNPSHAFLVLEKMSTPEEVAPRPSTLTKFSGRITGLDAPDLVRHVKEGYELDLVLTQDKKVTMLELSQPPTADATPAVSEVDGGE